MSVRQGLPSDEPSRYRRDGCVVVRGLLSDPELGCIREVFDSLATSGEFVVDRYDRRLVVTRDLWRRIPELDPIVRQLALVAAQLMGESEVRLLNDAAMIKPPQTDGSQPTNWHQDAPGYPVDRRGFLTTWIAVDEISLEQGPLKLVPGSHRLGPLGAVDGSVAGDHLESLLSAEDRALVGEPYVTALQAGDATIHDGYLLHAADANQSSRPRRAWGVRFIPANTLFTGASNKQFDGLGLKPFEVFDHEFFPLFNAAAL